MASRKVLVFLDAATNTIGIVDGFVFGEFSDREGAMRFVRARGLKLAGQSLDAPAPSTEAAAAKPSP
jgi:hypothetical protein